MHYLVIQLEQTKTTKHPPSWTNIPPPPHFKPQWILRFKASEVLIPEAGGPRTSYRSVPSLVACIPVVLSYSQLPCRSSNASCLQALAHMAPSVRLSFHLPWPPCLLTTPPLISRSSTLWSLHSLLHFINKLWLKIHHMLGSILDSWGIWKWTTDGLIWHNEWRSSSATGTYKTAWCM